MFHQACQFLKRAIRLALPLGALGLLGCSLENPGVKTEAKKIATFHHLGNEAECASCHERNRPAAKRELPHGNNQDCLACHKSDRPWKSPLFNHTPPPQHCTTCHLVDRPQEKVHRFDHASPPGQGECAQCHTKGAGDRWGKAEFSHLPEPPTCIACHEADRPSRTTHLFEHAKDGTADCAKCHSYSNQNWRDARFFHGPEITSCNRCHDRDRPKFRLKSEEQAGGLHFPQNDCFECHQPKGSKIEHFEYKHNNALMVKTQSCLPCHLADGKKKHEGEEKISFEGPGNCIECHKKRASWDAEE